MSNINPDPITSMLTGLGIENPAGFVSLFPKPYFDRIDKEDYVKHSQFITRLKEAGNSKNSYRFKGDIEEFVVHEFDLIKFRKNLLAFSYKQHEPVAMYRIFANQNENFFLSAFYRSDLIAKHKDKFEVPDVENFRSEFINEHQMISKHLHFSYEENEKGSTIKMHCINISKITLITNISETFPRHDIFPSFIEIWQTKNRDKQIKNFYTIECYFNEKLSESLVESLQDDFERYLQTYIKPMSIFDMIGPAMVGPSSSHTAGANRIGQIARNVIIALMDLGYKVSEVEINLLGSFRDTGVGHRTPLAIGSGIQGIETDDERMLQMGDPVYLKNNGIVIDDAVINFKGFTRGTPDDDLKYRHEKNNNMAEIIVTTDKKQFTITGFSIGGGNVEVRYINSKLEFPINGKKDMYFDGANIYPGTRQIKEKLPLIRKIYNEKSISEFSMPFNTFEELSEYITDSKRRLVDIAIQTENRLQTCTEEEVFAKMATYWKIMQKSIKKGLADKNLTLLKLTGQDSNRVNDYIVTNSLFDNIYGKAIAYATAVNEINAKSGVIIACPTAGACGILPGVLQSYKECKNTDDMRILESLVISGFLGMILFTDVSTAGADYGCQAEVGAATAMAAAALAYLEGGNYDKIINAFILALKNCLGLICDPVAGLVEIPCVKRNGIYSSMAISAAVMALSGVKSYISADEVVLTMKEVGDKLNSDYKETAGGGLAKTRDGKQVERQFEIEVNRFFA